jgi:TatD DNase family protein
MDFSKTNFPAGLIDIHAHLDFPDFDSDREEILKELAENDIWVINPGIDRQTSQSAVQLARANKYVFAAIGLHPHNITEGWSDDFYFSLAGLPEVVAVGECGLDFSRLAVDDKETKDQQIQLFEKQATLASQVNKPLILHCRDAHQEALSILKNFPSLKVNVHFFSADWKIAKKYLDLGCSLSMSGIVVTDSKLQQVAAKIPVDSLMAETDSPFAAPPPFRGQRNQPQNVVLVMNALAKAKNMKLADISTKLKANAQKMFGLNWL